MARLMCVTETAVLVRDTLLVSSQHGKIGTQHGFKEERKGALAEALSLQGQNTLQFPEPEKAGLPERVRNCSLQLRDLTKKLGHSYLSLFSSLPLTKPTGKPGSGAILSVSLAHTRPWI